MANPTGLSPATDLGGPDRDSAGISRYGSAALYGISPPSGLSACEPKQRMTLAVMIGCVDARPHSDCSDAMGSRGSNDPGRPPAVRISQPRPLGRRGLNW